MFHIAGGIILAVIILPFVPLLLTVAFCVIAFAVAASAAIGYFFAIYYSFQTQNWYAFWGLIICGVIFSVWQDLNKEKSSI